MKRFALPVMLLMAACTRSSHDEPVIAVVRGVTYEILRNEIDAAALDPPNMLFVRVSPRGANFDLVLDALSPYVPNKLGPNVPTVSRLNSNKFGTFTLIENPGGPLICILGPELHYNCGLNINDGPVRWGVLFDKSEVRSAASIQR